MFAYGLSLCVGTAGVFLWVQISSSSKDTELEPILMASFEHITSLKPYLQSQTHPEVLDVKASTYKVGGGSGGHTSAVAVQSESFCGRIPTPKDPHDPQVCLLHTSGLWKIFHYPGKSSGTTPSPSSWPPRVVGFSGMIQTSALGDG